MDSTKIPRTTPRFSSTFDEYSLSEIRRAAATGIYDIRGGGAEFGQAIQGIDLFFAGRCRKHRVAVERRCRRRAWPASAAACRG